MLTANQRAFAFGLALATAGATTLAAQNQPTFDKGNRTTVGDWAVECLGNDESDEVDCQLYQRVLTQDSSVAAMVVALAWSAPAKKLLAQVSLPLGSDLTKPPLLSIDNQIAADFAWSRCVASGCLIEATLPGSLVAALAEGESATFTVVQPNAGGISIPLSLNGFVDGLSQIMPEDALPTQAADESE